MEPELGAGAWSRKFLEPGVRCHSVKIDDLGAEPEFGAGDWSRSLEPNFSSLEREVRCHSVKIDDLGAEILLGAGD